MRAWKAVATILLLTISCAAFAQSKEAQDKYKKAMRDLDRRNLPGAEKNLREAVSASPDWPKAQAQLADVLFAQQKYEAAAQAYAKARDVDDSKKQLDPEERRNVLDQLGISLALNRQYDQSIAEFQRALKESPDDPLFHYNLACAYAEKGNLQEAIPHLRTAWEHRDQMPKDQPFPDPRKDNSFKKFWNDPAFEDAVRDMVI